MIINMFFKSRKFIMILLATLAVFFSLYAGSVLAGWCDYCIGGCGGLLLECPAFEAGSAAECTAFCGGRSSCNSFSPSDPWGCMYSY